MMTHRQDTVAVSIKSLCFQIPDIVLSFTNAVFFFFFYFLPNSCCLMQTLPGQTKNSHPLSSSGNTEWKHKPMLLKCAGFQTGCGEKFKGQPCANNLNLVLLRNMPSCCVAARNGFALTSHRTSAAFLLIFM